MLVLQKEATVLKKQEMELEKLYDGSTPLKIIKEELLISGMLLGMTKREAGRKAGVKGSDIDISSYVGQMLKRDRVHRRLVYRRRQLQTWFDVEAKKNLQAMACVAYTDPADFFDEDGKIKEIEDIPKHARMAISGIEFDEDGKVKKLKIADRNKAHENVAKVLGQFNKDESSQGGPVKHVVVNFNDIKVANITRDDRDREDNSTEFKVSS